MWNTTRIATHVIDGDKRSSRVLGKNEFQRERLLRQFERNVNKVIETRVSIKMME